MRLFQPKEQAASVTWLRNSLHEDPKRVFSIHQDGTIRISGEGFGYLATDGDFENYHLSLEYRWGDQQGLDRGKQRGKALDSGVFLHARGPHGNSHDGDGAYMAAIECNIFEGATGDFLLIRGDDADGRLIAPRVTVESAAQRDADGFPKWEMGGQLVTLETWGRVNNRTKSKDWEDRRGFRGPHDLEKPPGQWNRLECLCEGDTIAVRLNGATVNRVTDVHPSSGKILLQCEGAEILFRNVVLRRLESEKAAEPEERAKIE